MRSIIPMTNISKPKNEMLKLSIFKMYKFRRRFLSSSGPWLLIPSRRFILMPLKAQVKMPIRPSTDNTVPAIRMIFN